MARARRFASVIATLAPVWTLACVAKPALEPERAGQTLVVLLQDSDTGSTGRAQVANPSGSTDLSAERQSTVATAGRSPSSAVTLSAAEVDRLFGEALAALPPAPQRFTLYFKFESDELTDESRALMQDILSAVKQRTMPEVVVVGHTDTMGTPTANVALGLKRATTVRKLLAAAGLDISLVELMSHGEAEPIVRTADDTAEPRNRRVEIAVR